MEILSPAGDMERLIMALTYGADAVYLAGQRFGMRAASGNFAPDELRRAAAMCREKGVKVYVTVNAIPRNEDVAYLPEFFEQIQDAGADAVIVADLGVMQLAKKYAPRLAVHISTQAGIMNFETARAFYDLGAKRIILARELTLDEIAEIRAKTPREMDLEAFGHGSMCVSFSGRCLLSNYLTGRDANRGECSQPCRWKYHLVEEKRPGEYMEISEDGGTHIMNSRDLCMIDHLPEMISAGITSLKIEGRMKSAYYAAAVTNAYRNARDAAVRGDPLDPIWRDEIMKVSHREYSTGFYFNKSGPGQYYENAIYFSDSDVVAQVEACGKDGSAVLTQRNKFFRGDRLELLMPDGKPIFFSAERMINAGGEEIDSTPHPMMTFRMQLPVYAPKYSFLRRKRH
ncbi:MAG: U32 family peptidase [Oscillospiraceae bacterium]